MTGALMTGKCVICGTPADDLIDGPDPGTVACPTIERCDWNANRWWIEADIQAGIDAMDVGRSAPERGERR